MKQSRLMSMLETCLSTAIGFVVAVGTQLVVFPLFNYSPPLADNFKIAVLFTAVSLVRGFLVRRLFERMHIRRPLSSFMTAVIEERFGQIEREGWDLAHDDRHDRGELARAGATYLLHAGTASQTTPHEWPWDGDWYKPKGTRRDLVRGVALGIAEGEKFDRERKPGARFSVVDSRPIAEKARAHRRFSIWGRRA